MNDPRHFSSDPKKISLKQALLTILLSVCLVSGSCFLVLIYFQHIKEKQRSDSAYQIVAIVQTSPDREGLKTSYLAELLGLSIDRPINLYRFNTQEAVQTMQRLPVIQEAKIRKIRPGTIHVDYVLRKPIAYLGDYTNTAIDSTGTIIPFKPFYTPKNLPTIYLGEDEEDAELQWGTVLKGKRKELAFALLDLASKYCDDASSVSCLDVSKAFASSDGQREIVLVLEDRLLRLVEGKTILCISPRMLRLRQDNYLQQLGNYLGLRSYLRERDRTLPILGKGTIQQSKPVIVDLRLSELAFISTELPL